MLWLCLHLPLLPLSALGSPHATGTVVDQHGSQRWLITPAPHSPAGTPLSRALSLQADLPVLVRRPGAERETLRSLAHWIYRYGQPVCAEIQDLAEPGRVPRPLLWVEIGRSLALFGGIEALRDELCGELLELGHAAQVGIAPTRAAAALLACAGTFEAVTDAALLEPCLASLPLPLLHWPDECLQALSGVGLRHLGELFAIPREAFAKRFGTERRLQLDQLLGQAPEPFAALVPPETFRRRFELGAEIEDTERLQFPLKRLCGELQAYLRACDRGLRGVTLCVAHANARETRIHAQFVDPHRDAQRIFDALRERLDRDGLPLAARELILLAEDFAEAAVPQNDLFDAGAGRAQAWNAAVERLRSRLGEAAVWRPLALADHRPEHAAGRAAIDSPHTGAGIRIEQPDAASALAKRPGFLLKTPWPMPPPALSPGTVFERIETGWWDGQDVQRDYTTLDINGGRAWAYREIQSGQWFLQGWWS